MSVKSVLHKLIDELNRPHLHAELEEPEEEKEAPEVPEGGADSAQV